MSEEQKEAADLKQDVRRWSDTADRLLMLEDQHMSMALRRLLREIAEARV